MLKKFRKPSLKKSTSQSSKKLMDVFKFTGDAILRITQVAASIATCFIVVEMRNRRKQLHESQTVSESNDDGKNTRSSKDDSKRSGNVASNVIKVVVSITAVAASIATCFTVVEMRNERKQLYKPQMILESNHYSDDYEKNAVGIRNVQNLVLRLNDEENYPPLETTIYNIGSGAALEIEINFVLDNYKEYVEAISEYYSEGTITAGDSHFIIHYDGLSFHDRVYSKDLIIRKPFLLSGESVDVAFPKEFCKLLYYFVCSTYGDSGWDPTVHIQISFLDLQGIRYCIDYELAIQITTRPSEQGDKYLHVDYSIEQSSY